MNERAEFEKFFPVPKGVFWCDEPRAEYWTDSHLNPVRIRSVYQQNARWEAWLARASFSAANVVAERDRATELARKIHETIKRGRDTADHGLIGNLSCVLDHVSGPLPDFLASTRSPEEILYRLETETDDELIYAATDAAKLLRELWLLEPRIMRREIAKCGSCGMTTYGPCQWCADAKTIVPPAPEKTVRKIRALNVVTVKRPPPFTWIPVTLGVPRVGRHVLVSYLAGTKRHHTHRCKQIIIGIFGDDGWHFTENRHKSKLPECITHWMVITPPPRITLNPPACPPEAPDK